MGRRQHQRWTRIYQRSLREGRYVLTNHADNNVEQIFSVGPLQRQAAGENGACSDATLSRPMTEAELSTLVADIRAALEAVGNVKLSYKYHSQLEDTKDHQKSTLTDFHITILYFYLQGHPIQT